MAVVFFTSERVGFTASMIGVTSRTVTCVDTLAAFRVASTAASCETRSVRTPTQLANPGALTVNL